MLLKRSMVLATAVLLFIIALIVYFAVSHNQMEDRFRAEREKFHVEGAVLISATPPTLATTPSAAPASSGGAATNIVEPVPPPSAAPDSTTAPGSPDTNSAPAATPVPPASTMDYPRSARSSYLIPASYRPADGLTIQMATSLSGQLASSSAAPARAPASETNAVVAPVPLATNAAPAAAGASPAVSTGAAMTSSTNAAPVPSGPSPVAAPPAGGKGKVIVLLYHQFKAPGVAIPPKFRWTMNADVFESEMKYIHDNGYHVIPMSDLLKFLKHEITVPPNSVCITIDDGYKSAIVFAAPILKKYGYPWTFFIYPDFITTGEGPGAASWKDLLDLQAQGIDIECHSMTHPNLKLHKQKVKGVWHSFTPEEYAAWLNNETAGAKTLLEQKMGKPIICFAYPYGEYNTQVKEAVIAAGFQAIFTVADNPVHSTTPLYDIGRYTITLDVVKDFPAYLRQGALELDAANPAPGTTITDPRPVITAALGYAGSLDPNSIETSVRDYGEVRHDFDPQTNMLRLYLPRDLIQSVVLVNLRAKDAATGQILVANWHFNYELGAPATPLHNPITLRPPAPPTSPKKDVPKAVSDDAVNAATNAPPAASVEPSAKSPAGAPRDAGGPSSP
jgi:peptidoglycan/xylan/chitin deacetylase (PgdA/CDA1 family)